MQTERGTPDVVLARHLFVDEPGAVRQAATLLRQGHLVAFPTDTVYGLGVCAFDESAVRRLYAVKRRPLAKAIPILLADFGDLNKVAHTLPDMASVLVQRFWPGPLTVIVPKHPSLPAALSPNEGVALRIPDNAVARRLIRLAGGALATSSANISGRQPALTGEAVLSQLGRQIAAVLDGGPAELGQASTVVDCTGHKPVILRQGPITAATLAQLTLAIDA